MNRMPGMTEGLVTTQDAAKAVNVHPATLRRWVDSGKVTPTSKTLGGHARWDVQDLLRQIADILAGRS